MSNHEGTPKIMLPLQHQVGVQAKQKAVVLEPSTNQDKPHTVPFDASESSWQGNSGRLNSIEGSWLAIAD